MMDRNGTPERAVNDWLLAHGSRCAGPADLLHGYCTRLRDAGIPVERSTLGAPLLHPIAQSSYVFWNNREGASQRWFRWTPDALETMRASPIHPIYTRGKGSRIRLARAGERGRFPIADDLWQEGFHEYLALPLQFSDGTYKALTLATRRQSGFLAGDLAAIRNTLPALALVFEGFIARNTARTLMETYVGKRAGLRVLDGEIARGDGSRIDAVIWFSDLRGYTGLSAVRADTEVLEILNAYFELVTAAIEEFGGEVLKFIGDAMLAVFPLEGDLRDAVRRAEQAARSAIRKRDAEAGDACRFGIGLHVGTVFYGNVGGGTRLDFTVIGSAVNIASRIEGLTATLGKPLLVSGEFRRNSSLKWISQGRHVLKGVPENLEIFSLSD